MSRVEEIRQLEQRADKYAEVAEECRGVAVERDRQADEARWQAAALIHAELEETGKSHRQLGKETGKSHTHVRRMAEVWTHYGNQVSTVKLPFNKLYKDVSYSKPSATRSLSPKSRRPDADIAALDAIIAGIALEGLDAEGRADVLPSLRSRAELLVLVLSGADYRSDPRFIRWEAAWFSSNGQDDELAELHVVNDDGTTTPVPIKRRGQRPA
jgi:hypothetical protein